MQIGCPSCKKSILLDDGKAPAGPFKIKCPGCGYLIAVSAPGGNAAPPAPAAFPASTPPPVPQRTDGPSSGSDRAAVVPGAGLVPGSPEWEQLKREVAHQVLWHLGIVKTRNGEDEEDEDEEGRKLALVCEDEPIFQLAISEALAGLRYRVDKAADKMAALDMLSKKAYDLVTVDNRLPDDPEGGTHILQAINGMPPDQRRKMFVAFITADLSTMDTQSAFVLGANLTVGKKDIRRLDKILHQAIKEHDKIYNIFRAVHEELQGQER